MQSRRVHHALPLAEPNSTPLIRLLPPLGCPGESFWVVPVEVGRWLQQGCRRAAVPALTVELFWLSLPTQPTDPEGSTSIELLLQLRQGPQPRCVQISWGDGTTETVIWPAAQGSLRRRHGYAEGGDQRVSATLNPGGAQAELDVALLGCPIWPPQPPQPNPVSLRPLIPGVGLQGRPFDGSCSQQWNLQTWSGGSSSGGVPPSRGGTSTYLRADGSWATPPSSGGTRWFSGEGPPGVIPEAQAGDFYLETRRGDLYRLELS
jgi:hypothetical protein